MSQRTCATCDAPVSEPKQRRCDRCKWVSRQRVPCEFCGEATGWPVSSGVARASHPRCRPVLHGLSGYRRGCRCDVCRAGQADEMRRYYKARQEAGRPIGRSAFPIECAQCGAAATATSRDGRFCSLRCAATWGQRPNRQRLLPVRHPNPDSADGPSCRIDPARTSGGRRGEWWTLVVSGPCAWCGESFTGLAASVETAPRYCGKRCLGAAGRMAHRERHGRFVIPRRRRLAIYDRDGWTCQLCREPVDPDATDEWRATLDHVIPQSHQLFPDHSDANLRLTHLWCNSVRQDNKIPDEWFAA